MKKIVMNKGLPASGKSTWAKEFIKGKKDWVRVNNDDLQTMMNGVSFATTGRDLLDKTRRELVKFFMSQNMNIIIDNTNLHPDQEAYYRALVEEKNFNVENQADTGSMYQFEVKDFTGVSVNECLKRNKERPNAVPESVIYQMHAKYLKKEQNLIEQDENLPTCIVVDLDGTMSVIKDRTPWECTKCYGDDVNKPIAKLVRGMFDCDYKLIFCSGRDESARAETVRWLKEKAGYLPEDYTLYLRPDGDKRKDTQFKVDVFNEHIKDKYYVLFWIEDRWRMADAVRNEIGITCLQCADGHF